MNHFQLNNKTIFITGASSGIGQQTAITVSELGAKVIITGRNKERLTETLSLLKGNNHEMIVADLLNDSERENLIGKLSLIDGIVHCAGFVKPYPIKFISNDKINETFDINFKAQVLLMAGISKKKLLKKNASIVFMSSISAQHPHKGGTLYSASKAAVESFSKVMALEFYNLGIRSNCISAAMVKTPMYEYAEKDASKEVMDAHVNKYPLGVGEPIDIANAAVFLLSDASKWVTGTTIVLDGGFLLGGI